MPWQDSNNSDANDNTQVVITDKNNAAFADIINDGTNDRLAVSATLPDNQDEITDALITISYAHHEIHEGDAFNYIESDTLNVNDTLQIALTTPDTLKRCHLVFVSEVETAAVVNLYENPTTLVTGAVKTPYNRERNSANTNTTILNVVTSVAAEGTSLYTETMTKEQHTASASRSQQEWMLKQNEEYILEIKSSTNGNFCQIFLDWYEHTNPS